MGAAARLLPLVALGLAGCGSALRTASTPPEPATAATPPLPGYTLVWHDEFDGTTLDTTRWTVYEGARRQAQNAADAVSVANGLLTITTYTDGGGHRTGFIDTARHFLTTYGWFEARMRFESAPGEWGAFWLQSPTMGNPVGDVATAGTEIDVAEHRAVDTDGRDIANTYSINLHWGGYGAAGDGAPAAGVHPGDLRSAGRVVGWERPRGRIRHPRGEHHAEAVGLGEGLAVGARRTLRAAAFGAEDLGESGPQDVERDVAGVPKVAREVRGGHPVPTQLAFEAAAVGQSRL
jgi:hypothetical protein